MILNCQCGRNEPIADFDNQSQTVFSSIFNPSSCAWLTDIVILGSAVRCRFLPHDYVCALRPLHQRVRRAWHCSFRYPAAFPEQPCAISIALRRTDQRQDKARFRRHIVLASLTFEPQARSTRDLDDCPWASSHPIPHSISHQMWDLVESGWMPSDNKSTEHHRISELFWIVLDNL